MKCSTVLLHLLCKSVQELLAIYYMFDGLSNMLDEDHSSDLLKSAQSLALFCPCTVAV